MIEVLVSLFVALIVVTVVGHAIWVALVKLYGVITGVKPAPASGRSDGCPVCRSPIASGAIGCGSCGWVSIEPGFTNRARIALRQIDELASQQKIAPTLHQAVATALLDQLGVSVSARNSRGLGSGTLGIPDPGMLAAPATGGLDAEQTGEVVLAQVVTLPVVPESAFPTHVSAVAGSNLASTPTSERSAPAFTSNSPFAIPAPAEIPPASPRRTIGEWFSAFLEEKHIRWGELVGGLLIVSCSIALVISFWSKIAERPFLKFGVFNGVTAALLGVGLHAARRWKLPHTSQGILLIGSLLVPLNFLAIAALAEGTGSVHPAAVAGEVASVVGFAILLYWTARVIQPEWPWAATLAVLGPCVVQLLIRRYVTAGATEETGVNSTSLATLYGLALTVLTPYIGAHAWALAGASRLPGGTHRTDSSDRADDVANLADERAGGLFTLLGIGSFAVLLTLGLLLFKSGGIDAQARWLSPLVGIVALPTLAVGLSVMKRLGDSARAIRVAATSLIVLAAVMLLVGLCIGWPQPCLMIPSAMISLLLITAAGLLFGIAEAQIGAAPFAVIGTILVAGLATGRLAWRVTETSETITIFTSPVTQHALLALAGIYVIGSVILTRARSTTDAYYQQSLALVVTMASLLAVAWRREWPAWWYFGELALAWLAIGWLRQSPLVFTAFQAALTACVMLAVNSRLAGEEWYKIPRFGWLHPYHLQAQGLALTAMSVAWIGVRLACRSLIHAGDTVTGAVDDGATTGPDPAERWSLAHRLLSPSWPSIDRLATVAVLVILVGMSVYGVIPGVMQELSPRLTSERVVPPASLGEIWSIPHAAVTSSWMWALVAMVAGALALALLERYRLAKVIGLALAISTAFWLGAARWEAEVAVASALRWWIAGLFGIGSLSLWLRRPIKAGLSVAGWPRDSAEARAVATGPAPEGLALLGGNQRVPSRSAFGWHAFASLVVVIVAPILAMGLFVAIAALRIAPPTTAQQQALTWLGVLSFGLAALWLAVTSPLMNPVSEPGWLGAGRRTLGGVANVLVVLGTAPLIVMSLYVVGSALVRHPIVGPEPGSFFSRIGLAASYAIPLAVIAAAVVGHAIHLASPRLALAGGLLLNFCATAAYLLSGGKTLDTAVWLHLGQLNAMVAAVFATSWVAYLVMTRRKMAWAEAWAVMTGGRAVVARSGSEPPDEPVWNSPLSTQVGLALGFTAAFLVPAVAALIAVPDTLQPLHAAAGAWGWTGALLSAVSFAIWSAWNAVRRADRGGQLGSWTRVRIGAGVCGTTLAVVASLAALETQRHDVGGWTAYRVLQYGMLASGLVMSVLAAWVMRASASPRWTVAFWCASVVVSLGDALRDPGGAWWGLSGVLGSVVLASSLAGLTARRRFLYAAGALVNFAAGYWWVICSSAWAPPTGIDSVFGFFLFQAFALAAPVVFWRSIDANWIDIQRIGSESRPRLPIAFHRVATGGSIILLLLIVFWSLFLDSRQAPVHAWVVASVLAIASVVVASLVCLWDGQSRGAICGLYLVGLIALAMFFDSFDLRPRLLIWTGTMALAAYGVATSYLWSRRAGLRKWADRLLIPARSDSELAGHAWLVPLNLLLAVVVTVFGYLVQLTFLEPQLRLSSAQAIVAQAFAIGMLARGKRETQLRYAALAWGVLGVVAMGWSGLDPRTTGNVFNRTVVVAAVLAGMGVFYGFGLTKIIRRVNAWTEAGEKLVPALLGLALAAIGVVLVEEVVAYVAQRAVEMSPVSIAVVAATLVGLAVAALLAALVPGRDPLGLSEEWRQSYVYAAEAIVAVLFVHFRLTMPWLFQGFFLRFWPLVVMLIAYIGIGASELFRRQKRTVLAQPLERTGVLLPLLPVIGFWLQPTAEVHYSVLMLTVGALYAGVSALRSSIGFGVLAALAVNASLWVWLHEKETLGIAEHPQLWLIPPALSVLAATAMNRKQLSDAQSTSIRYACSTIVYTSSTADIFLNGVAEAPWLPFVLAAISLAGIAAGILFRVRAFLFLGTSFLVVALLTVIWHAAVDLRQTWLWFVTGIAVGVLIIAAFALLEKKRQEVLAVIERLKQWDG